MSVEDDPDVMVTQTLLSLMQKVSGVDLNITRDYVGKYMISTVQLVVNHGTEDAPLWYETMVFERDKDFVDLDCERYRTKEEAEVGHKAMVAKWMTKTRTCDAKDN